MSSTACLHDSLANFTPTEFSPIRWRNSQLELLDQRQLPHQVEWLSYADANDVAQAITDMVVRGAPAIGITAAYGVVLSILKHQDALISGSTNNLKSDIQALAKSRPTAINLHWALDRMSALIDTTEPQQLVSRLAEEAIAIHQQDIDFCHQIGQHGASLISEGSQVYTHCNAGALATGGHGTALGVIRTAFAQNKISQVYAGETRPWFQGARLTSWELLEEGIPTFLVTEGAAGHTLKQNKVDWVIVGSDRIAADGSVANKIGTYNLAILARHHGCKVMVAAPSSTFDLSIQNGNDIPIEQRPTDEVTHYKQSAIASDGVKAINPSFDVTPPELVDVIVTERGIIHNPSTETIQAHFA